jgi:hypothetical protein
MREVVIAGVGMTKFGRWQTKSQLELFGEAAMDAINNSKLKPGDIQALFLGNSVGDMDEGQTVMASHAAREIGLQNVPATRIEGLDPLLKIRSSSFDSPALEVSKPNPSHICAFSSRHRTVCSPIPPRSMPTLLIMHATPLTNSGSAVTSWHPSPTLVLFRGYLCDTPIS